MTDTLDDFLDIKTPTMIGVGSANLDYKVLTSGLNREQLRAFNEQLRGAKVEQGNLKGYAVINHNNHLVAIFEGPYKPDSTRRAENALVVDQKHMMVNVPAIPEKLSDEYLQLIIGKDVMEVPGGGIVNFARAIQEMDKGLPFLLHTLRGENCFSDLVEGTYSQFRHVLGRNDQSNLVLQGTHGRTIIRGDSLKDASFDDTPYFNPRLTQFKTGTIVVNSLDTNSLAEAAIKYYNERLANCYHTMGVICITPKMDRSYELIAREAIPNGFLPIFSPIDLMQYAYRNDKDSEARHKEEPNITYQDIIVALRKVRDEQEIQSNQNRFQRMYVTLGDYGSIGVDHNGKIHRIDVFDNISGGKNKVGAGDVYAAVVTYLEHLRFFKYNMEVPIHKIMVVASAAAINHINNCSISKLYLAQRLYQQGSLNHEIIGTIDTVDVNSDRFNRTLKDVGKGPVSRAYSKIELSGIFYRIGA